MTGLFDNIVVAGIPLLLIVLGLVEWVKSFGLQGNAVRSASMAIGLLLGIGYQFSVAAPVGFGGWFTIVVFGLGLGLVASGVYDAAQPGKSAPAG
jgi:hypothetical protein